MANLAVWLMSMVGPLAKKILVVLGIGTISYAAMTPLLNSLINHAKTSYGQIGGALAQFLALAGIPEVFGIISGALLARLSFMLLNRLGKVSA